jgi:DNA-binding PadR family transcriptional regulator
MTGPEPAQLSQQAYHILVALGGETMHGYGIIQSFEELTSGAETLLPGSLYAALSRMADAGLLKEVAAPATESSGGPARRYYRVTAAGRAAARAETARRERVLRAARARGLAPEGGGR